MPGTLRSTYPVTIPSGLKNGRARAGPVQLRIVSGKMNPNPLSTRFSAARSASPSRRAWSTRAAATTFQGIALVRSASVLRPPKSPKAKRTAPSEGVDSPYSARIAVWSLDRPSAYPRTKSRPAGTRPRKPARATSSARSAFRTVGRTRVMRPSQPALQQLSEHAFVVAVPVALESLVGIVAPLGAEKLRELRVARLYLLARREPMVGQVVAPAVADPRVDELSEFRGRALEPSGAVDDVQVEDHACVRLFGPGKKTLVVLLDETDGAVDEGGALRAEPLAHVREKAGQRIPRRVDLGDQLRGRLGRPEPAVQGAMVIVEVRTELVRVRPVHLS